MRERAVLLFHPGPGGSHKITRIVALLRAAVAVALYLTAVAVAAGYDGGRWFAVVATTRFWPSDDGVRLLPAAIGVLNAWALWQILRGPAAPRAGASDGLSLVVHALGGLIVVWAARTAHELAAPGPDVAPPGAGRTPALLVAVAVVLVLPMAVVGAERDARLTYTAADEGCRDQLGPAAGRGPEERRRSFLCLARGTTFAADAMFPENLADQRILAYGGQLCALPGDRERQALYERAGGTADVIELVAALDYLCPGIVARQTAEARRRQAEHDRQEAAWKAEANARCADPWPGVRARRQGTAAYLLFEGGGYAVFDDRDDGVGGPGGVDGESADIFAAIDDGFIDAAGSSAAIVTDEENAAMCLTVKAFGSAPPLRLAGWDQVVEVGIASRSGRLVVPTYPEGGDSGAAGPLPGLAVAGPGHYRLRVHARTRPWDENDPDAPLEEHLLVVYPGRSTAKVVHRSPG